MNLKEIMNYQNFVVIGKTLDKDKYAYKIKNELIKNGYNVAAIYQELNSINDVEFEIDVIDLCINPFLGLKFLKECHKKFKAVLIQPGAESVELINYLKENNHPFLEDCALIGLKIKDV